MKNETLHDVVVCIELQREMIMKLFEFCEKSKEDRRTYEQARMEALQMRKSNAADYINEHNRQIKEKIQILKDQITAKE